MVGASWSRSRYSMTSVSRPASRSRPAQVNTIVLPLRGKEDGQGFLRERLRVGALGLVFRLRRPAVGFQESSPHDGLGRGRVRPLRPLDPHLVQEASATTGGAKVPRHRPHADANVRQHVQRPRIEVFDGGLDALQNRLHVAFAPTLRGDRCSADQVGPQHEHPQCSPAHPETIATTSTSRNTERVLEVRSRTRCGPSTLLRPTGACPDRGAIPPLRTMAGPRSLTRRGGPGSWGRDRRSGRR